MNTRARPASAPKASELRDADKANQANSDLPEWLEIVEGGAARITLNYPTEVCGVNTSVITMRRPKVRDRKEADKMFKEHEAQAKEEFIFCNLTDMSPDELDELDMDDYQRLQAAFESFLSSRRRQR